MPSNKNKNRTEFTKNVKKNIINNGVQHCCNPSCRKLIVSDGIVAHIIAASPNGPRGDKSVDKSVIRDSKNAIYLCFSCEKIVDSHPDYYTIEMLTEWKQMTESIREYLIDSLIEDRYTQLYTENIQQKEEIKKLQQIIQKQKKEITTNQEEYAISTEFTQKYIHEIVTKMMDLQKTKAFSMF